MQTGVLFFIGGFLIGLLLTVASVLLWLRIQIKKIDSRRRSKR
jgi:uncharacterized membrane protein YciS (DUF1049 family)